MRHSALYSCFVANSISLQGRYSAGFPALAGEGNRRVKSIFEWERLSRPPRGEVGVVRLRYP